jgi:hypothetical protein
VPSISVTRKVKVRISAPNLCKPAAVAGILAVGIAAGTAGAGTSSLQVTSSDTHPGARHVALQLRFEGTLQCGTVTGAPLKVTLPAAAHVPGTMSPRAVLVNAQRAGRLTVAGTRVTIAPKHPPVLCDILTRGPIVITFMRTAGLGNPPKAGAYTIAVARGTVVARGTLTIR